MVANIKLENGNPMFMTIGVYSVGFKWVASVKDWGI
jgi:hypothetical protein